MAEYTPEQIAESRRIAAWADEQERQARDARRTAYRDALRPIVTDPAFAALRADLGNLSATTAADDNLSMHVAALIATMDRLTAEPL